MALIEEIDERQAARGTGTTKAKKRASKSPPEYARYRGNRIDGALRDQLIAERAKLQTRLKDSGSDSDDDDDGYWMVVPLFFVHTILSILVRMQYAQEYSLKLVLQDSWVSLPLFAFLFAFFHPKRAQVWAQALLLVTSILIGGYLVYIANEEGYYATMYKSPPLGTLWVWQVIEMPWYLSVISLVSVGAYTYLMGYSL